MTCVSVRRVLEMPVFLVTMTIASILIGSRKVLQRHRHSRQTSITKKTDITPSDLKQSKLSHMTNQVTGKISTFLIHLDNRYQHAFQRRVEALVSKSRNAQWQAIKGDDQKWEISPEDKIVNRRIARFGAVVVTAALAKLYPPLIWLTALLASYELIDRTIWTYRGIKQKKRMKNPTGQALSLREPSQSEAGYL